MIEYKTTSNPDVFDVVETRSNAISVNKLKAQITAVEADIEKFKIKTKPDAETLQFWNSHAVHPELQEQKDKLSALVSQLEGMSLGT